MDIFGIGGNELLVIILLAVIVLGPERIVRVARQAGRFVREVKAYFASMTDELKTEIDLLDDMKDIKRDLNAKL